MFIRPRNNSTTQLDAKALDSSVDGNNTDAIRTEQTNDNAAHNEEMNQDDMY